MDLGVIEVVVNTGRNTLLAVLKVVLIVLAVCFLLLGIVLAWPLLIPAAACGVGAYFADLNTEVDYEYALVDNELRVARILKKEKRKKVGTYDMGKLEILARENAHQLDAYRNSDRYKTVDCASKNDAEHRWAAYVDGNQRILLTIDSEEGERLIKSIRQFAPSKVIVQS